LSLDNARADLQVAPERAAVVGGDGQAGLFADQAGRGSGAAKKMLVQDIAVRFDPSDKPSFLWWADKRDAFLLDDYYRNVSSMFVFMRAYPSNPVFAGSFSAFFSSFPGGFSLFFIPSMCKTTYRRRAMRI
jgi:hypothetical protein